MNNIADIGRATDDGLAIGPIHTAALNAAAIVGRPSGTPWIVVQRIDDPDSPRAADSLAEELDNGAGGIELVIDGSASQRRSGFGLDVSFAKRLPLSSEFMKRGQLRIDAGDSTAAVFEAFRERNGVEVTLAFDPLAEAAARGGFERAPSTVLEELAGIARGFADTGRTGAAVVGDGRVWAAGGASEIQELAGILGSLAEYARLLMTSGLTPGAALGAIAIVADAGANQTVTIAKLRALRLLHARLVEAFGAPSMPVRIHAETSWRMMARYDVHTNILRTTSAAFAAGVGGADSITVLPFSIAAGLPDAFARRLARNQQILLIEESELGRVGDPAAGAGTIESLTEALAEAAWARFRAIEGEGGLLAALRAGTFQKDIVAMRDTRAGKIARREIAIVGVSDFPNLDEVPAKVAASPRPARPETPVAEQIPQLGPARLAKQFEALRDRARSLADAGRPVGVFVVGIGPLADHAAARQSAIHFYAAGGIRAIDGGDFDEAATAAEEFVRSGARTACIVGGDAARGADAATALKERGAAHVAVIGAAIASPDIDAAIEPHVDAVALLSDILDAATS